MANTPWDRLPDEDALWYDRFIAFRNIGPTRTIENAFRQRNTNPNPKVRPARHWYRAAARFDWRSRAAAWDIEMRRETNLRAEEAARRSADRITADEWEVYEKGFEKLRQFLALPLVRQTTTLEEKTPDGTAVIRHITVEPLPGTTMGSLAAVMTAVIVVGRQAAGLEDADKLTTLTPDQIQQMSEGQLRALHEQLSPILDRRRALEPPGPRRIP